MSNLELELNKRSKKLCELCSSEESLTTKSLKKNHDIDSCFLVCSACLSQIDDPQTIELSYWKFLEDKMWSEIPVIQVMSAKILSALKNHTWASDLLDQLYLSEENQQWADEDPLLIENDDGEQTVDSNGTPLIDGDSITIIKDLVVKGANFTAKRGTTVKNISLTNNPLHIEGKVNGTKIVLVAAYLKKL